VSELNQADALHQTKRGQQLEESKYGLALLETLFKLPDGWWI
jgi:hypothetical protein